MNKPASSPDLVLAGGANHLAKLFPTRQQRERYVRYLVARYSALNVTWQGVAGIRGVTRTAANCSRRSGSLLKKLDPYNHPRSTDTHGHLRAAGRRRLDELHRPPDGGRPVGCDRAPTPRGALRERRVRRRGQRGRAHPPTGGRLPQAALERGHERAVPDVRQHRHLRRASSRRTKYLDSPGARQMTVWFDFFSRHAPLGTGAVLRRRRRPRAGAGVPVTRKSEGIEYIVYVEKPGPVEIVLQNAQLRRRLVQPDHRRAAQAEGLQGRHGSKIAASATRTHDWVLHVSREGKKRGHAAELQVRVARHPGAGSGAERAAGAVRNRGAVRGHASPWRSPSRFAAKVTRETRATRTMMWLWTGEVSADGQGYRVLGTGPGGRDAHPRGPRQATIPRC